jgi:hypothetical protein
MLVITQGQMGVLKSHASVRFEEELTGLFLKHYPGDCRLAGGEPQIRQLVRHGILRAKQRGCRSQEDVSLWVSLSFMLGVLFDDDPQLPWLSGELLALPPGKASGRMATLHRAALDYLGATAGENGESIVRALLRLRAFDPRTASLPPGPEREGEICALLDHLYPEKYRHQGEAATIEMIRRTTEVAAGHGIRRDGGLLLCILLAFMLGIGFDRDYLYPWVTRAFADPALGEESARVDRLYQDAIHHLNESLTGN